MTAPGTHSLTRSRWAAIGAAIAITLGGGGLIGVSASGTESTFVPVEPGRILDTRNSTPVGADNAYGTPLRLKVTGADLVDGSRSAGIPSTATAVAATITATSTGGWGFVTAYPCDSTNDTPPGASNVNYTAADQTVANSAIVPLSTDGYICLTAYDTTHLLLDVSGYYTAASSGGSVDAYTKAETDALLDAKADASSVANQQLSGTGQSETVLVSREYNSVYSLPVVQLTSTGTPVIAAAVRPDGFTSLGATDDVNIRLIYCDVITCQGERTEVEVTEPGSAVHSLRLSSSDVPLITFVTIDGQYYARCSDASCSGGIPTPVQIGTEAGQVLLDVDANDRPGLVWVSGTGDLYFAKCTSIDCTSRTENVVATQVSAEIGATSFHFSPDGSPVIAYTHTGGGSADVRLVTCNDPVCDGGDETDLSLDNDTNGEKGVDFAFTSTGLPMIAYTDKDGSGNDAISLLVCSDATCSTSGKKGRILPGRVPSISIDAQDRAHISFLQAHKVVDGVDFVGEDASSTTTYRVSALRCLASDCPGVGLDETLGTTIPSQRAANSTVTSDGTILIVSIGISFMTTLRTFAH